jgi:hypothetical protein
MFAGDVVVITDIALQTLRLLQTLRRYAALPHRGNMFVAQKKHNFEPRSGGM